MNEGEKWANVLGKFDFEGNSVKTESVYREAANLYPQIKEEAMRKIAELVKAELAKRDRLMFAGSFKPA
ncbi:MAG: hypothetical protein LBS28_01365 [Streptococcaceae bacterium]|jgi:hypothetical protein|nr:hypothetical protein [Streptococcaceae bacterium]